MNAHWLTLAADMLELAEEEYRDDRLSLGDYSVMAFLADYVRELGAKS